MDVLEVLFWACAACVLYTYVGYAALLAVVAKLCKRTPKRQAGYRPSVSFVTCAHNEAGRIGSRVEELTALLTASGVAGEIIVVSDGSTDGTADTARLSFGNVRVLDGSERLGKAASLSLGCRAATNEILVFADSRQRWDNGALLMLLENFADPRVGAVSGATRNGCARRKARSIPLSASPGRSVRCGERCFRAFRRARSWTMSGGPCA
jgi:biofilm PGA synthesis N-glycosyltransferase PgaC